MSISKRHYTQEIEGRKKVKSYLLTKCMEAIVRGVDLRSLMPELAR